MPTVHSNGLDLYYETFGEPTDPVLLLIMGLGQQLTQWPDEFCKALATQQFHVIRFDNRDALGVLAPGFVWHSMWRAALT